MKKSIGSSRKARHFLTAGIIGMFLLTILFRYIFGMWPWISAIDFLQNYHPFEKQACVNNGGRWMERGFHGVMIVKQSYCDYPPYDRDICPFC